jgi:hypothetical protein
LVVFDPLPCLHLRKQEDVHTLTHTAEARGEKRGVGWQGRRGGEGGCFVCCFDRFSRLLQLLVELLLSCLLRPWRCAQAQPQTFRYFKLDIGACVSTGNGKFVPESERDGEDEPAGLAVLVSSPSPSCAGASVGSVLNNMSCV